MKNKFLNDWKLDISFCYIDDIDDNSDYRYFVTCTPANSRFDYWIDHTKNTIYRTGGIINYVGKGYNIKKGNPLTKLFDPISTDYGLNRHLIKADSYVTSENSQHKACIGKKFSIPDLRRTTTFCYLPKQVTVDSQNRLITNDQELLDFLNLFVSHQQT